MKKFITKNYTAITFGIIFVFVLWFTISKMNPYGKLLFPSIEDTFSSLGELLKSKYFYRSLAMTMYRTFIGFIISFALALVLGILSGTSKWIYNFLYPLVTILKAIPTASLVFIFLALSDVMYASIYIVILLAFPILYEAIASGVRNVDKEVVEASKVDGANFIQGLGFIKLPLAIPYILLGLLTSFGLSLKTEIMAEIVTGNTGDGLGCMISAVRLAEPGNLAPIFAIALVTIIIVLLISLLSFLLKLLIKRTTSVQ